MPFQADKAPEIDSNAFKKLDQLKDREAADAASPAEAPQASQQQEARAARGVMKKRFPTMHTTMHEKQDKNQQQFDIF